MSTYTLVITFDYNENEDVDKLSDEIVEAVVEIVDPGCDGELQCPRDWSIEGKRCE